MQLLTEIEDVLDQKIDIDPTKLSKYIRVLKITNLLLSAPAAVFYTTCIFFFWCLVFNGWNLKAFVFNAICIFFYYVFYIKKLIKEIQPERKKIVKGIEYLRNQKQIIKKN